MSLKDNLHKYTKRTIITLLGLALTILFIVVGLQYFSKKLKKNFQKENRELLISIEKILENKKDLHKLKDTEYEEFSPDQSKKIILYKMEFDPKLYNDYYGDYFSNQKIIAVRELENKQEDYIFTGEERTGDPHWLGNDYIFFTTYCGTACKGVYLVNINNKESQLAVWGYIFSKEKSGWETHFNDWFGGKFIIKGLVNSIESKIIDGKIYLIFKMKDDKGNSLGEKRFVFIGEKLIE